MELKRYELRRYDDDGKLLSYVPFDTEKQAQEYFDSDEEMGEDWDLYLVTYTPSTDHAQHIRKMRKTKKQLKLGQLITLLSYEFCFEVALYEEDEEGNVYRTDSPVGFYECQKDSPYDNFYTYKHIGDKRLKHRADFGDLVVVGIEKYYECDTDTEYDFQVCVKVKKDQVEWGDK